MPERLHFPQSFEAITAPGALVIPNGEVDQVVEAREHFFDHIRASLELGHLAIVTFCEEKAVGDEHQLWFSDLQPLASTTETHSEQGWVVTFAKNNLTPRTVQIISDIDKAEAELFRAIKGMDL